MGRIINNVKMYNVKELALILKVHEKTAQRYFTQGRIKGVKIGGSWYISDEALNEYLKGN